jgi:hypothetical protein
MKNMLLVATGAILAAAVALGRPAPLPEAQAQAAAADGSEVGPAMMGIGGSTQNQNDLCWVLFRDKARKRQKIDHDRFTLCLYRAINNGQAFDLVDVREVTYDFKASHLGVAGHKPGFSPQAMKKAYEEARDKEDKEGENANRNP